MKLTSLVMMLLIAFSAAAQEEFFDDVYFSSKNKKKKNRLKRKRLFSRNRSLGPWSLQPRAKLLQTAGMWMNITVVIHQSRWRSLIVRMIPLSMRIAMRMSLLPSVVRILNIRNVSFVIIRRVRLRSPERIKSICI